MIGVPGRSVQKQGELLRILGVSFGVSVAIGNVIGAGILRAPSLIAAEVPDAWLILALWVIGAVHVATQANVVSELAAALPRAGGAYVYVSRAFGDIGGLAVGWTSFLSNVAGAAALSVAFGDFLGQIWPAASHSSVLTAVVVLLVLFGMNVAGLRQGSVLALLSALGVGGVARSVLPFTTVLASVGGAWTAILFGLCAMVTVASSANASIMAAPRILLALARDRLLPRAFASVNRGGSPQLAYLFTAVATIALAASGSFGLVFGLIATLNAAGIILVILGYFVLRRRAPELERPFRAIAHPWLPAVALVSNLVLFVLFLNADWLGAVYALVMLALCVPFALVARRTRAP
jgi:amino acid transporter